MIKTIMSIIYILINAYNIVVINNKNYKITYMNELIASTT